MIISTKSTRARQQVQCWWRSKPRQSMPSNQCCPVLSSAVDAVHRTHAIGHHSFNINPLVMQLHLSTADTTCPWLHQQAFDPSLHTRVAVRHRPPPTALQRPDCTARCIPEPAAAALRPPLTTALLVALLPAAGGCCCAHLSQCPACWPVSDTHKDSNRAVRAGRSPARTAAA